jgi:hypothetical protein
MDLGAHGAVRPERQRAGATAGIEPRPLDIVVLRVGADRDCGAIITCGAWPVHGNATIEAKHVGGCETH